MSETLQHLVLVRHGQSEGDARREAWKQGKSYISLKRPEDEEQTALGETQSAQGGLWVTENILGRYALKGFEGYFVSMSTRSVQSAVAMDFKGVMWLGNERLNERNRGRIRGLRPEQHRELFPDSYEKMKADPLHWIPPGGESMLDVAERFRKFYRDISFLRSAIVIGHRDQIWGAMQPLEGLSEDELLAVDTDKIGNGGIIHYTSLDPITGEQAPALMWKWSVDPMHPETSTGWQVLPHIAERFAA